MKTIMIPILGLVAIGVTGCVEPSYDNGSGSASVTPYLQDLVGAKGRDGEYTMKERGFVWIRTEKSDTDSYSYWRHNQSGQCINIRTSDGRYAAIVKTPDFDCQKR